MVAISVIMLVYRTEPFVERALRSVCEQTLDDMEIILVNDATPDRAMEVVHRVLRDYPHRQVRIVEHEQNRGSAAARQTGLDAATGEYTIHVDSDDWVESPMLEKMLARARRDGADIVCCDMWWEYADHRNYQFQCVPDTGRELARALIRGTAAGHLCDKLIRRALYTDNGIVLIPGLDMWEDLVVTTKLAWFAGRVSYISEPFLHYVQSNPTAMSRTISAKKVDDMIRATDELAAFVARQSFVEEPAAVARYANDVVTRKLTTRRLLIEGTTGRLRAQAARLWPEVGSREILSQQGVKPHYRLAHWIAAAGSPRMAGAMYSCMRFIVNRLRPQSICS